METVGAFIVSLMILLIGWILFMIALLFAGWIRNKKISFHFMIKDFRQKIWMTAGLGSVFFTLYFLSIYAGSFLTDPEKRLTLFFLMRQHQIEFIYLGLFLFVSLSMSIYLVRLLIKYLCNRI